MNQVWVCRRKLSASLALAGNNRVTGKTKSTDRRIKPVTYQQVRKNLFKQNITPVIPVHQTTTRRTTENMALD